MLKQLLLATVLLGAWSSEARAFDHPHSHQHLDRHAYHRRQVDQHRLDQSLLSQRRKNHWQQARARAHLSAQLGATTPIAPELSGSVIAASPGFADGYRPHSYQHRDDQRRAYQMSADQHRLFRHRLARGWCGAYLSAYLGKTDRRLALAREWAREGSNADGPGIGVVVVWPHHVGVITARAPNGQWLVHSGNDGGAVRTRPLSLRGVIAFRRV